MMSVIPGHARYLRMKFIEQLNHKLQSKAYFRRQGVLRLSNTSHIFIQIVDYCSGGMVF